MTSKKNFATILIAKPFCKAFEKVKLFGSLNLYIIIGGIIKSLRNVRCQLTEPTIWLREESGETMRQYYLENNFNLTKEQMRAERISNGIKKHFEEITGPFETNFLMARVMICPDVPLPALNRSCYQKITDIFGEIEEE